MEGKLDTVLNNIVSKPTNVGALVANKQGLCIQSQGKIATNSAGLLVAILEQASKLEPNSNPPVVSLECGKKTCLIHKHGITGVVYKEYQKPSVR